MKIKFYYLLLALMALLMSCGNTTRTEKYSIEYEIVEIDSCEYILVTSQTYGIATYVKSIAHKGNCKYCEERRNHVAGER